MLRRTLPSLVPLALAGLLTGCAGGSATGDTTPTGAPASAAASPSAGGSPVASAPSGSPAATAAAAPGCATSAGPVPTTGPAVDRFGAGPVQDAYMFAADWIAASTFTAAPLGDPHPPQTAFAGTEAGLTPAALVTFRKLTELLASTTETLSPQQNADLLSVASYGTVAAAPGATFRTPAYRDVTCGPAITDVYDNVGGQTKLVLRLRFPISGTFQLVTPAGVPEQAVFTKKMDLSMLSTGDPSRPWLVDGWRADLALDGPDPDPAP